jgi:hypothetical protein
MAGPPIPPSPVPAINKTYTDVKFFLKNAETTKAFEEISFTGTSDGYPSDPDDPESALIPYPNEDFDNTIEFYPYIDLPYLSAAYEIKIPEFLDNGSVGEDGVTVTALSNCFADVPEGMYLLYRIAEEDTDLNNLRVLGYIQTKTSDTEVILSSAAPTDTAELVSIEIFSWPGEWDLPFNIKDLNALSFHFQDSFYMVVKNADYTFGSGNHDGVLLIDTARTSANYTNFPQPFAYSNSRILNPNYFSLERISKVLNPTKPETNQNGDPIVVNIPCSIKGISKWSEKSMFANTNITDGDNRIPFWSVYEIDPNPGFTIHLDRKTFYRLTINTTTPGGLPSSKVFNNFTPIE